MKTRTLEEVQGQGGTVTVLYRSDARGLQQYKWGEKKGQCYTVPDVQGWPAHWDEIGLYLVETHPGGRRAENPDVKYLTHHTTCFIPWTSIFEIIVSVEMEEPEEKE